MTRKILVAAPLGSVIRLEDAGDGVGAIATRPTELNSVPWHYDTYARELKWLRDEGFVELAAGAVVIEPNEELEKLCKTNDKA